MVSLRSLSDCYWGQDSRANRESADEKDTLESTRNGETNRRGNMRAQTEGLEVFPTEQWG